MMDMKASRKSYNNLASLTTLIWIQLKYILDYSMIRSHILPDLVQALYNGKIRHEVEQYIARTDYQCQENKKAE